MKAHLFLNDIEVAYRKTNQHIKRRILKLANKNTLYSIIIIGCGMIGLLLNQTLIANLLSRFVLMTMLIIIYFDKEYRLNSIPHIPNRLLLVGIALIPLLTGLQYVVVYLNSKVATDIFIVCMEMVAIAIVYYIFKNAIKRYPEKWIILLILQVSLYFFILFSILTCF